MFLLFILKIQANNGLHPHRKLKNLSPEQYEKSFFSIGQETFYLPKGGQIKPSKKLVYKVV